MDSTAIQTARKHLENAENVSDPEERQFHIRQARQLLKAFDDGAELAQHRDMAR